MRYADYRSARLSNLNCSISFDTGSSNNEMKKKPKSRLRKLPRPPRDSRTSVRTSTNGKKSMEMEHRPRRLVQVDTVPVPNLSNIKTIDQVFNYLLSDLKKVDEFTRRLRLRAC